jgi:hypothetical protein
MKTKEKWLTGLILFALSAVLLPSWTALSSSLYSTFPRFSHWSGPLNPLKIFLPFLILFCFQQRKRIPGSLFMFSAVVLGLGTLFTAYAAARCAERGPIIREWLVFCGGWIGGLSLYALTPKDRFKVVSAWMIFIFGSALLDLLAPSATSWLLQHVFDPSTGQGDFAELGLRPLTTVYSRQSIAKLLVWTPWIWIAAALASPLSAEQKRKARKAFWVLAPIATAGALAASQRGPFLAMLVTLAAYALNQFVCFKNLSTARVAVTALIAGILLVPVLAPKALWLPRIKTLIHRHDETVENRFEQTAEDNKTIREKFYIFSLGKIAQNPLGDACIPEQEFTSRGMFKTHAHSLFLEQYRSKGWIWGTLHLTLWLGALILAWRRKTEIDTFLAGGVLTVIVSGVFDHLWFALTHAVVLSALLLLVFGAGFKRRNSEHA